MPPSGGIALPYTLACFLSILSAQLSVSAGRHGAAKDILRAVWGKKHVRETSEDDTELLLFFHMREGQV